MLGSFLTAFAAGAVGEYNDRGIIYDTKTGKFTSAAERQAEQERTAAIEQQLIEQQQKLFEEQVRIEGKVEERRRLDALDQVQRDQERETALAEVRRLDALYNIQPSRGIPFPEGLADRRVPIIDFSVGPDNKIIERTLPVSQDLAEARAQYLNETIGKQTDQVFYSTYDSGKNGHVVKSATRATPPMSYDAAMALAQDLANKLNENTDTTFKATVGIEQKNGKPSYKPNVVSTSSFSSKEEAEAEAQRRNAELIDAGSSNRAFVEIGGDGVITVVVRGVTGKQDTSKPENDPKITDQTTGVAYGFNYLLKRDNYPDDGSFTVHYLKPDLPVKGDEMKNLVEGEDYLIRKSGTTTNEAVKAGRDVEGFNSAFTEKIIDAMIENNATRQLEKLTEQLIATATMWQKSDLGSTKTKLKNGGEDVEYENFYVAVPIALYLRDKFPYAKKRFDSETFLKQAIEVLEPVVNNPARANGFSLHPTKPELANNLYVHQHPTLGENPAFTTQVDAGDGGTVTVFKPEVVQTFLDIENESDVDGYTLGTIISGAPDTSSAVYSANAYRVSTDDLGAFSTNKSAEQAYDALVDTKKILNRKNPRTGERIYSFSVTEGGRTVLRFPVGQIGTQEVNKLAKNLTYFGSTNNSIIALQATIPAADVEEVTTFRRSGVPLGQATYDAVTGNTSASAYADLSNRQKQAQRLKDSAGGGLDAIGAGGTVGFEASITRGFGFFKTLEDSLMEGGRLNSLFNTDDPRDAETFEKANKTLQEFKAKSTNTAFTDAERADALLKYHLTIAAYAYASMNDPNGRLSDADRANADAAIGALGKIARVDVVRVILEKMYAEAERQATYLANYQSGNARVVLATHGHKFLTDARGGSKSIGDLFGDLKPVIRDIRQSQSVSIQSQVPNAGNNQSIQVVR